MACGYVRCPSRRSNKSTASGHTWGGVALKPGDNPLAGIQGELFDIRLEMELEGKRGQSPFVRSTLRAVPAGTDRRLVGDCPLFPATAVALRVRDISIRYDCRRKQLTCLGTSAPLEPAEGKIELEVLLDRSSLEIFAGEGRIDMAYCITPLAENKSLAVFAQDGEARVRSLEVWELKSIGCNRPSAIAEGVDGSGVRDNWA